MDFKLYSPFSPTGDQPQAIEKLTEGVQDGIRTQVLVGVTGSGKKHVIEYSLKLESNPEFMASVIVACARAVYRLNQEGSFGCKTMFDVPPVYLSSKSREELIKTLL